MSRLSPVSHPHLSTLLAASLLCCSEHEGPNTPGGGNTVSPSAPEVQRASAAAPDVQENTCPPHIQCHPQWATCRCSLTARGDVSKMEADFEGDGRPNLRTTYLYDDAGNLLRWEHDQGADGTVELPCVFEPPCAPPHPNDACSCYGPAREVSAEYVQDRLRQAAEVVEPVDPAEAQRILDAAGR